MTSNAAPPGLMRKATIVALKDADGQDKTVDLDKLNIKKGDDIDDHEILTRSTNGVSPPQSWFDSVIMWSGTVGQLIWVRVATVVLFTIVLRVAALIDYPIPTISPIAHSFVGLALGLLLVFRTNNAYDRYYEGRKAFERFLVNGRFLSMLVATTNMVHRTGDKFVNLFHAFVLSVKHRVRGSSLSDEEVADMKATLEPGTATLLMRVRNRPLALIRLLTEFMLDKTTNGEVEFKLIGTLQARLSDCIDAAYACERIINTPIPIPYQIHMRQMLVLYVATLPIVFEGAHRSWASVFSTFMIAFGLLGIEEAGTVISNPFGDDDADLPLEMFCKVVHLDMSQTVAFGRLMHFANQAEETTAGLLPPDGRLRQTQPLTAQVFENDHDESHVMPILKFKKPKKA